MLILPTLLLAFAPAQSPASQQGAILDDFGITNLGGIEAPTQPTGRSTVDVVERGRATHTAQGASSSILVRVGDLAAVRGQEENVVQGVGLLTGLQGSGDSGTAVRQALRNLLLTQNVTVNLQDINSKNVAVVWVEASLPPGVKPGRRVDVRVSSIYDCSSLVGGNLVSTELTDTTGQLVFATATGPVTTGAFSAGGEGATAVRNHLTVGTIPLGAKVERPVPSQLVNDQGFLYLDMHAMKGSFANTVRITDAINEVYAGVAEALDAMTVRVQMPHDLPEVAHVAYVDSLLQREIEPEAFARVIINERTGVIVMGEGVRITRGAITKGNLTVTIAESPEASQPGALSGGGTEQLPRTNLLVEEENRALTIVNGAVKLQEVVEVLNVLGVTPRDMIQILQSMSHSGMLQLEIIAL